MAYVRDGWLCTKDFVCVAECATAAIAPQASDANGGRWCSQVYINPDECIDCGNCANVCAQNAIFAEDVSACGQGTFCQEKPNVFSVERHWEKCLAETAVGLGLCFPTLDGQRFRLPVHTPRTKAGPGDPV